MFKYLIIIGITVILVPSLYYLLYWIVKRVIREMTVCDDLDAKQLDLEWRIKNFNNELDAAKARIINDINKLNTMEKFINNDNQEEK